jgi:crotonobetainyl-CoA:carnitine CoA-transferase CaiB-like acyl-CoA transferase
MDVVAPKLPGTLAGVTIVDLSRVLAGPFCTQILADHGAEVIKVEPPQGDETREWGPPFQDGLSSYFTGINRNKRSLGLDLADQRGRAVLLKLLARADVLIENFKPGTMEKWGIGYTDVLAARFPRLIHCRVSGFGADGPFGGYPGYDAVVQTMTGLHSVNGKPESGPVRIGVPLVDLSTGLYAAIGILAALAERAKSGAGQFLEVTLFDSAITLLHPQAANWFMAQQAPRLSGNGHLNIVPYDLFATKNRPIFLGVGNDRQFAIFCREVGRPELAADPRFATNPQRLKHRAEITEILRVLLAEADGEALARQLAAAGVPAGPAFDVPEVLSHPHTRHRGMVLEADGYRGAGTPIKFSRTPGSLRRKPPQFGADGRAILAEVGLNKDDITGLIRAGVVAEERRK